MRGSQRILVEDTVVGASSKRLETGQPSVILTRGITMERTF